MNLQRPEDAIVAIRDRLPNCGEHFLLCDLVNSFEESYSRDRYEIANDDSLVVVAGKFGENENRQFEVAFTRSFDLTTRLEVSLGFPIGLKCLFLRTASDICESISDSGRFFANIRLARWYRRYKTTTPTSCLIRWRDEAEMARLFVEVVPKLASAMKQAGCNWPKCTGMPHRPH
jgi:hypothetical protein